MEKLNTIQKTDNLNEVYRIGEPGPGGACHEYGIFSAGACPKAIRAIYFQKGHRNDPEARQGVLDEDLLEIVRDRLTAFQVGEFSCRENACALHHIEEALMWLNRRKEDRRERGVLGSYKK